MKKLKVANLTFAADTCGAVEETKVSAVVIMQHIRAATVIMNEAAK